MRGLQAGGAACRAVAFLALGLLAACQPLPGERDPTQAPSGALTGGSSDTITCTETGGTQFTLTGTVSISSGPTGAQPSDAKVFVAGLPCAQASVGGGGSYTLEIATDDAASAGFLDSSVVRVIAWVVDEPFLSVTADSASVTLDEGASVTANMDLNWAIAGHITVEDSLGRSVSGASILGISDADAHGFAMTRFPSSAGATFDTGYLPPGSYTVVLELSDGSVVPQLLHFPDTATKDDAWFNHTINL